MQTTKLQILMKLKIFPINTITHTYAIIVYGSVYVCIYGTQFQ